MKTNIVQPLPSVNIRRSVALIHRTEIASLPDSDKTLLLPLPLQRENDQIIINRQLNFSLEDNE
jgi:hypothetical protein